jgi:membrane protease YdiL (CAAX protease family)
MGPTSAKPPRYPHWVAGLALFAGVVVLADVALRVLSEPAAIAATPLLVTAATLGAVVIFRADLKETLQLKAPSTTDVLMAIPLTLSFFILDDQLASLSHARFPVPNEALEYARRLLTADGVLDWIGKIALIGVGAAVSEELMFRGFIQTAFLQRFRPPVAITLAAVLFMLLHVQFLPVLAAGIVLGYVTLATRSIVIAIVVHFGNNVIQLLLFNFAELETLGDPVWIPPTILIPALIMFALSWGYYIRRLAPEPASGGGDGAGNGRERIMITHEPKSIEDELSSVPKPRRRLGWLVVFVAMLTGVLVLVALFGWSVYYIYPERVHERGLELLEERVTAALEPQAANKAQEIASAFAALSALNDSGQLELRDLTMVARTQAALSADGGLDERDADAIVETIRTLVMDRTTPRAL